MERQTIIFWVFIGIFSITAIVTLLGITNVIKVRYLRWFVSGLILEVVGMVLAWGSPVDYSTEIDRLWAVVFRDKEVELPANEIEKLTLMRSEIELFHQKPPAPNDSILQELNKARSQISDLESQLREKNSDEQGSNSGYTGFINNVLKLRAIMRNQDWDNVNLDWQVEEKDKAGIYDLLPLILNPLEVELDLTAATTVDEKARLCQQSLAVFILRPGIAKDSTSAILPLGEKNPQKVVKVYLAKWMLDKFILEYLKRRKGE